VLETAILNLLRGTNRKGLTALASREGVVRPLLKVPKSDLRKYARDQGLRWREDSTNKDEAYLRNYIRHRILSRFSAEDKKRLLAVTDRMRGTNKEIDALLAGYMQERGVDGGLDRAWFAQLPHAVAREVMAAWLREHDLSGYDRQLLERTVVAAKVGQPGKQFPLLQGRYLLVTADNLALGHSER
jgi:tRNA(Ile)-lysidine synthase